MAADPISWTHVPRLVVFDLDYTLWSPYIDVLGGGPFTKTKEDPGQVLDRHGQALTLFPQVPTILTLLLTDPQFQTTKVAIASRTAAIDAANECLGLLEIEITTENKATPTALARLVHYVEIFPSCKLAHFAKLQQQSGVSYQDMLFFDDEYRNIEDVQTLGVTCYHCQDGLSITSWRRGMAAFQASKNEAPH